MENRSNSFYLINSIAGILLGSSIYIFFRSSGLIFFQWFKFLDIYDNIIYLRNSTLNYKIYLSDYCLYSLPDGLWVYSYVNFMFYLSLKLRIPLFSFWLFLLPLIALMSEILQLVKIMPGQFDIFDFISYLLGLVIPILLISKRATILNILSNQFSSSKSHLWILY